MFAAARALLSFIFPLSCDTTAVPYSRTWVMVGVYDMRVPGRLLSPFVRLRHPIHLLSLLH